MTVIDFLIIGAAAAGALIQTAFGVGFSLVVAPLLMITIGAKAAVPILLVLNIVVSLVGVFGSRLGGLRGVVRPLIGAAVGITVGNLVFPMLSEPIVLVLTGTMLIVGAVARPSQPTQENRYGVLVAGSLAGIATAWTATPGPVAALGLSRAGYDGNRLRRTLQPFALASYAMALVLTGREGWIQASHVDPRMLIATSCGAGAGLLIGPRLPGWLILPAIRLLALMAGVFLIARALIH
jgi:uncharacterized protein